MKICIDARKIDDYGIGTYVRNLLNQYSMTDSTHAFYPIFAPRDAGRFPGASSFTPCVSRSGKYSLREQWDIPRIIKRVRADVYHSPHYVTSIVKLAPTVVTIHDLIHLIFPEYLPSKASIGYAKAMLSNAVKQADRIITDSECSKSDLINLLNAPEKKIHVIHLAADGRFGKRPESEWRPVLLHELGIMNPYILFVGNLKVHKNVAGLIRAFNMIPENLCRLLVIAGKGWNQSPLLQQLVKENSLSDRVLVKERLSFNELNALYNGAELFVLPSLYEGFGLPPLEAMSAGTPVAASNVSSIPEICGDAAVYFNPARPDEIADRMLQLLKNVRLRKIQIQKGFERVKRYSWDKTAKETLNVYQEAV